MDFIFGTLATDELKLIHHRAARTGVQHLHQLSPRDPHPGESVVLTVDIGAHVEADSVTCYFTTDGTEPDGLRGHAINGEAIPCQQIDTLWDTLTWGYRTRWQVTLPAQTDGTIVRYRIGAWHSENDKRDVYADWPDVKRTAERAATAYFRNQPLPDFAEETPCCPVTFAYHVDHFAPPQWARDAIIYQIFVDRFHPGDGVDWLPVKDLSDFHGGTLWGVRDRMDYIADLGATCIWLSPTFVSPTYHGYDIVDYYRVEPRLGGDEALHAVVAAAHKRGLRVLLDLACNHTSHLHPHFQDALKNPHSPYRDWFTFDESEIGYRSFFGVKQMPELNMQSPAARDWMLDVARYWLSEFDVDGYRLDHADGPGPNFWAAFRAVCKDAKADSFCYGETVDAPTVMQQYIGRLDGTLDFHTSEALRRVYGYQSLDEAVLRQFTARHFSIFPQDFLLPTFLDNHDMDRFLFIAKGNKDALKAAARAQFALSGPPIIYYGTEVGMSQAVSVREKNLEQGRLPMIWDDRQDRDLLDFYTSLIRERKTQFHQQPSR